MESGPLQLIFCLYVGSLPDEPFYDIVAAVTCRKVQGCEASLVLRVTAQDATSSALRPSRKISAFSCFDAGFPCPNISIE
jgi:hypothetical protein